MSLVRHLLVSPLESYPGLFSCMTPLQTVVVYSQEDPDSEVWGVVLVAFSDNSRYAVAHPLRNVATDDRVWLHSAFELLVPEAPRGVTAAGFPDLAARFAARRGLSTVVPLERVPALSVFEGLDPRITPQVEMALWRKFGQPGGAPVWSAEEYARVLDRAFGAVCEHVNASSDPERTLRRTHLQVQLALLTARQPSLDQYDLSCLAVALSDLSFGYQDGSSDVVRAFCQAGSLRARGLAVLQAAVPELLVEWQHALDWGLSRHYATEPVPTLPRRVSVLDWVQFRLVPACELLRGEL